MEYKEYEKLNFDLQYKQKGYPKNLWPILNEYFSRFKYEYELSDFEINDRIERLTSNLNKIKIGYFGEGLKSDGFYNFFSKHIKIKMDASKHKGIPLNFIDSIFHELNHVTDINAYPDSHNGKKFSHDFVKYDKKTNSRSGIGLNEIITELKAKRLFYNEKNDDLKLNGEDVKLGYPKILFIGSMIHTTLGISEREFLKSACKGREKFDEIMKQKFDDDTYDKFINSMYHYSDIIYSKKFCQNKYIDDRDCTNEVDKIKEVCLNAMERRMYYEKDLCKDNEQLKQFAIKCKSELEDLNQYYNGGREGLTAKKLELNPNENDEILYKVFGKEFDFSNIEQNNTVNKEDLKKWDNTELNENVKNVDKKNYIFSQMVGKYIEVRRYIIKKGDKIIHKLINNRNKHVALPEAKKVYIENNNLSEELKEQVNNDEEILKENVCNENLEYVNKEIENDVYEK